MRTYKGKESNAKEVHRKSIVDRRIRCPQADPYCAIINRLCEIQCNLRYSRIELTQASGPFLRRFFLPRVSASSQN